jgi:tRNA U34 5-carboxymethylaminomethyl modifying GTPase MnmE/TrmE
MKLLDRYNQFYNDTCAGLPHGGPISMEELQSLALRSAIYAFSRKYNMKDQIPVEDLENLADLIEAQGAESIKRHQTVVKAAQGNTRKDLDAL